MPKEIKRFKVQERKENDIAQGQHGLPTILPKHRGMDPIS